MSSRQSLQAPVTYQKDSVRTINKYNFDKYNVYNKQLNKIWKKTDNIMKKYSTPDEKYQTKVIKYNKRISMYSIIKDNEIILLNSSPPPGSQASSAGSDDRKKRLSELQKGIIRSLHKPATYNPYLKEKQLERYFSMLHRNVTKYQEQYLLIQEEKEANNNVTGMLYSIISSPIVEYITPIIIGVGFNMLIVASIGNPATWITMLPIISTSATATAGTVTVVEGAAATTAVAGTTGAGWVSFNGFLDLFYTSGFFDLNDVAKLKELYTGMVSFCQTNPAEASSPEVVKNIITSIFQPAQGGTAIDPNNGIYKFYKYIYDCVARKDIFNAAVIDTTNKGWLGFVQAYIRHPYGQFTLSSLQLASNIYSYIETTKTLFSEYENINKNIIFEAAFKYGTNTRTFHELTRYISTSTISGGDRFFQWICKEGNNISNNQFTSFVVNTWSSDYNPIKSIPNYIPIQKMWESNYNPLPILLGYVPTNFFTIMVDTTLKATITQGVNSYFSSLKEESKRNKVVVQKTEKEQMTLIEQKIIQVSKLKKEGYTNEDIAEFLDPTPEEPNNYQFFLLRYAVEFKKTFKKYLKNPNLAAKNISVYCNGFVLFKCLLTNIHNLTLSFAVAYFKELVLKGYEVVNLRDLYPLHLIKSFLTEGNISQVLFFFIKMYYGTDEAIFQQIELYKTKFISDIINDLQILHNEVQKVFFDSELGMSIYKYFKIIEDLWIVNAIKISLKIMNFVVYNYYLPRELTERAQPIADSLKIPILSILEDPVDLIKFTTFIDHKISNIIAAMKEWNMDKVFSEFKDFTDINTILLKNVVAYVAPNNYFEMYDKQSMEQLAGNLIQDQNGDYVILSFNRNDLPDETGEVVPNFSLFDVNDLFVILNNENKTKPSIFEMDPNNPEKIYEIIYAYYESEFKEKQKGDPKKFPSYDKYLMEKYNDLYLKVHDLPDRELPDRELSISKKETTINSVVKDALEVVTDVADEVLEKMVGKVEPTQEQIIELGILGKVLEIRRNVNMKESGWINLDDPWIKKFQEWWDWLMEKLVGRQAPTKPPTPPPPYKEYKIPSLTDSEIDAVAKFFTGNYRENIDNKKFEENLGEIFTSSKNLNLALPNTDGFRFVNVDIKEFFDVKIIMEYFFTKEEYDTPMSLLLKLEDYAQDDVFIAGELANLNYIMNNDIANAVNKFKKPYHSIPSNFSNFDIVLPLNELNFNYNVFYKLCENNLQDKKLTVEDGKEDYVFDILKQILGIDKACYSTNMGAILLDKNGYNINTNEKDDTCSKDNTMTDFYSLTSEQKTNVISTLIMRPEVIQFLHSHTPGILDFTSLITEEYNRQNNRYPFTPLDQNIPGNFGIIEAELGFDVTNYKDFVDFIVSNKNTVNMLHDNMIDNVITTIDVADEKLLKEQIDSIQTQKLSNDAELIVVNQNIDSHDLKIIELEQNIKILEETAQKNKIKKDPNLNIEISFLRSILQGLQSKKSEFESSRLKLLVENNSLDKEIQDLNDILILLQESKTKQNKIIETLEDNIKNTESELKKLNDDINSLKELQDKNPYDTTITEQITNMQTEINFNQIYFEGLKVRLNIERNRDGLNPLLKSFGDSLKKIKRFMVLDNNFKEQIYEYFVIRRPELGKFNEDFNSLDIYEQAELKKIYDICGTNDPSQIKKMYADFNDVLKYGKSGNFIIGDVDNKFSIDINIEDDLYKNCAKCKKNTNNPTFFKILEDSFNRALKLEINNPEGICIDRDINSMKQFIIIKYDLYKEYKIMRAQDFYDYAIDKVTIFENRIIKIFNQYNIGDSDQKGLIELYKIAKLRADNRKNIDPTVYVGNIGQPTFDKGTSKDDTSNKGTSPSGQDTRQNQGEGPGTKNEKKNQTKNETKNVKTETKVETNIASKIDNVVKEEVINQLDTGTKEDNKLQSKESEDSTLKNLLASIFGGDDSWLNQMTRWLRNFGAENKKINTRNTQDLEFDESYSEPDKNAFEDNFKWCKDNANKWIMHYGEVIIIDETLTTKEEKDKIKQKIIMKGCKQESLFTYSIKKMMDLVQMAQDLNLLPWFIGIINAIVIVIIAILTVLCWYIPTQPICTSALPWFISFQGWLANASISFAIISGCLKQAFLFFFSFAVDKMFQNNKPSDNFLLGNTLIQFAFLHLKRDFEKNINDTKYNVLDCNTLFDAYNGQTGSFVNLINSTEAKIKNNLLNKNPDLYNNINNKQNFLMYINVGAVDSYSDNKMLPDLDPSNKPAIITEVLLDISEQQKIRVDNLSKTIFNDCKDYKNYDIIDSVLVDTQKILNLEMTNFTFLNMFFCKMFDMKPPTNQQLQSEIWWADFIIYKLWGFDFKRLTKQIIAPVLKFILPRKKLRSFVLTNLFGSSSSKDLNSQNKSKVNFNIMRDLINESVDRILENSTDPNSQQIIDSKLESELDKEFTEIITKFFGGLWGIIYAFFSGVAGQVPSFNFDAYDNYDKKCIQGYCFKNELESKDDEHMKEYIRKALCEIKDNTNIEKLKLDEIKDILGINSTELNSICDYNNFYREYSADKVTGKEDKFNELMDNIYNSIQNAKKTVTSYDLIKINYVENNSKLEKKLKAAINIDHRNKYFDSLLEMIEVYKNKPYFPPNDVKLRDFIENKVNNTKNIYFVGSWNNIEEEFKNRNTSLFSVTPRFVPPAVLKVKLCNDDEKLVFIPLTNSDGAVENTYVCVTSKIYKNEIDDFEKELNKNIKNENNSNQLQIINGLIANFSSKINDIDDKEKRGRLEEEIDNLKNDLSIKNDDLGNKYYTKTAQEIINVIKAIEKQLELVEKPSTGAIIDEFIKVNIERLNEEQLSSQMNYNKDVNELENIDPTNVIIFFLKENTQKLDEDSKELLNNIISDVLKVLPVNKKNSTEINEKNTANNKEVLENLKANMLTLLEKIKQQNVAPDEDVEKMKELAKKLSIDNLEPDIEKLNKREYVTSGIYNSITLIDENLYAQRYFASLANIQKYDKERKKQINISEYNAFMYNKFFIDENKKTNKNVNYSIIDLLHKINTINDYTLTDKDKILILTGGNEILTGDDDGKIKENVKNLFMNKEFSRNLFNLLISEIKQPPNIKEYYDIIPSDRPTLNGKDIKYAGQLINDKINYEDRETDFKTSQYIDVYNQMYSYYGGKAIITDSGEHRITPIIEGEKTLAGYDTKQYIDYAVKIVQSKNNNIAPPWTQGKTKPSYSNELLGDTTSYEIYDISIANRNLARIGPPPIMVDIGDKFRKDIETNFREALDTVYKNPDRSLIPKGEISTDKKGKDLTEAAEDILNNYQIYTFKEDKYKNSSVYLLKEDIANFEQIFENFNASDYAKSLLDAELNKNKECDKITAADISKVEYAYLYNTGRDYIVDMCKKDIAVKYDYLENLKVRGIINDDGGNMSISDMKEYLEEKYGINQYIEDDINAFVKYFMSTSVLFKRTGVNGSSSLITLQENIENTSGKPIKITDLVVNKADIL